MILEIKGHLLYVHIWKKDDDVILEMHTPNLWKKYLEEIRQNKSSYSNVLLIQHTEFYT